MREERFDLKPFAFFLNQDMWQTLTSRRWCGRFAYDLAQIKGKTL
tara:strand:- start:6198 stop:6332 length:135 start_codon:yes stop_codon:yes gene_type:complete